MIGKKWAARAGALVFVATTIGALAMPGMAGAAPSGSAASVQSIDYIAGKDVTLGSCKGWLNRRSTDGYVQALGQSWGDNCGIVLERKRLGTGGYNWTEISDYYLFRNASVSTGFHWNGTDAGSRVCLANSTKGTYACGAAAW